MVPRLSSIGQQAAEQALAAAFSAASSSLLSISAFAAASTSSTVGATAPSPTRAAVHTPSFSVRLTPTPTTAMSISVLGTHGTRDGRADAETALGGFLDCSHLGDFLDVDDQARPHRTGAHLHQKIGATSHDARSTSGGGKCADRFIERPRA